MRVLFVHQNFPGQYRHIAPVLAARPGAQVVALTTAPDPGLAGVRTMRYRPARGTTPGGHPWVADFETKVIRGEAAALAALNLKADGFTPDIVCAHPGWGEALFLKEVWPETPLLAFMEFYYATRGADTGFDLEFGEDDFANRARIVTKNTSHLLSMSLASRLVAPTEWQKRQVPAAYRASVRVIHDGIDTTLLKPAPHRTLTLQERGVTLSRKDEVVTFVNRNLEPYRGYHILMRSLPALLSLRPNAHILIVGGDDVSYGRRAPDGLTWKQVFFDEVRDRIDVARVHFLGKVPYHIYIAILQVSRVHIYLTYPFVLSWSMLEAMASGCVVVGSATPPVEEVITHGENGFLVDFFDTVRLAETAADVCAAPDRYRQLANAARQTVLARYDLHTVCLPNHLALIEETASAMGS